MAHDNCDHCGQDYDFDKSRDVLVLFITTPQCNHVLATCPHCGEKTTIYLIPDSVMVVANLHLPLRLGTEAPAELQESAARLWDGFNDDEPTPGTPDAHWSNDHTTPGAPQADPYAPPRDWLMQLYDELRHFDHPCNGGCE